MSILRFLGLDQAKSAASQSSAETETVRKIVGALDKLEPDRAKFIASFAYVLSRVARADLQISPAETHAMEQIGMEKGGLPEEHAVIVVQMAKTQTMSFGATETDAVTREFNSSARQDENMALLHCLFEASAADQPISSVEDSEIRQIASELKIEHRDFITVRTSYRDHLAVL